jgi:hypothetical protein
LTVREIDIDTEIGEYLIPGEAEIVDRYVDIFRAHFRQHYEGKDILVQRAIHAKSHGLLRATLDVLDHGDCELQHGIFRAPRRYEAIVRISNGDGPAGPDTNKIASIGFAIKVRGVEDDKYCAEQTEDSQDFLFLNQPAYISKDVRGYESLMRAIDGGVFRKALGVLRNLPGILYRRTASPKDSPTNTFYWGVAPFRLGNTAVKYLVRPTEPLPKTPNSNPDGLKQMVRQHIEHRDANYDLYLQKRLIDGTELQSMPIEDYSVAWDENKSVPVHVGRLRMPQQEFDESFIQEGEHLVFSPWNTTRDFRPLGSLNRARRVVYSLSAQRRHELNGTVNPFA